jgi:hypothetical protein
MDNQQITLINDNYFAGLIDSDFGVYITMNMYKGKLNLRPRINFVNTRFELVEVCSKKLKQRNINHHVEISKSTINKDSKRIQILRLGKCIEFVNNWVSYSIVRKPQLELLKSFCIDRVDYVENFGWKYNNTPYTQKQKDIYKQVKLLNLNYNYDNGSRNYTFSWLAGMIDGDGSIYFSDTHRKCKYKRKNGAVKEYVYRKIIPWLKITTESTTALNNIVEIYKKYNVRYYVEEVRSKASRELGKHKYKFYYNITVKEFDHLLLLLNRLNGKLIGKQKQLELMLEYIQKKKVDTHYTDEVYSIVKKVKKLNNDY